MMLILMFILLLTMCGAAQALDTELVPVNVSVFPSYGRLCLSLDFHLRSHMHGPTFSEPYTHHRPEIPVSFGGQIEKVIGQISCSSKHLQWNEMGYSILQCYQANGTLLSGSSSHLLFQNSKGLGISLPHGHGIQHYEESFFLQQKRLPIQVHTEDSEYHDYHRNNRFPPQHDACVGECGLPSFDTCPRSSEVMSDGKVISYRVGSGHFHVGSYTIHLTESLHLSCTVPPIFFSCAEISPNGVCYRRPCRLIKEHGSLTVNVLKELSLEMLAPDPIQPLSDPFLYCLVHVKPSAVKLCTAALLHVQRAFNGSSYWEEMRWHDIKKHTEVKAVQLGSLFRQKTSLSFYALVEANVVGVALITMFLFMDTRKWTIMTWTL